MARLRRQAGRTYPECNGNGAYEFLFMIAGSLSDNFTSSFVHILCHIKMHRKLGFIFCSFFTISKPFNIRCMVLSERKYSREFIFIE